MNIILQDNRLLINDKSYPVEQFGIVLVHEKTLDKVFNYFMDSESVVFSDHGNGYTLHRSEKFSARTYPDPHTRVDYVQFLVGSKVVTLTRKLYKKENE